MATTFDVTIENHGSIILFRLHTDSARDWVDANVSEDHQMFGGALAAATNAIADPDALARPKELGVMAATGAALGWNLVTTRRQWRHLAWDVRTVRAALPARVEVLVGRVIPRAEPVSEPARRALPVGRAA